MLLASLVLALAGGFEFGLALDSGLRTGVGVFGHAVKFLVLRVLTLSFTYRAVALICIGNGAEQA